MKNEVFNTIFGSCPVDMSDEDILDAMISAAIGVTTFKLLLAPLWLTAAIAVATSIAMMHATKTLHPPGGATALIAVIGSQKIHNLGYLYVLVPAGVGPLVMLAVALLVNNLPQNPRYPEFWL